MHIVLCIVILCSAEMDCCLGRACLSTTYDNLAGFLFFGTFVLSSLPKFISKEWLDGNTVFLPQDAFCNEVWGVGRVTEIVSHSPNCWCRNTIPTSSCEVGDWLEQTDRNTILPDYHSSIFPVINQLTNISPKWQTSIHDIHQTIHFDSNVYRTTRESNTSRHSMYRHLLSST